MKLKLIITNPDKLRELKGKAIEGFTNNECFMGKANGHKFKVGEIRTLTGLIDFPEYNGEEVLITSIREDGPNGKAYYIKGRCNEIINWVCEYRLT